MQESDVGYFKVAIRFENEPCCSLLDTLDNECNVPLSVRRTNNRTVL